MFRTFLATLFALICSSTLAADRPNIVWIVTEDNSPDWLRLYNPEWGAPMPHIERLADEGLVFEHAFSNAPVCSVARSTLISGCYAPRVGAQYHRRMELVPLPGDLKMYPQYLREAGYYATNNSKEDYNFIKPESPWDESSNKATYRNRKDGQPFFHIQNYTTTHESRLHFSKESMANEKTMTDPDTIDVFPYHPDTSTFRYTYARQLEQHRIVDAEIGKFLQQLEDDGLMDETIIFYYGDHGGVLPRGKGYAYESGLHVPLVVRFPEKWQHLAPAEMGTRVDGFVSFVDLGPTVIHLAGANVPDEMDGRPIVGDGITLEELNSRQTAFGYADRFDEKYDFVRTWRKGKWKYMRSYQPFNFDGLFNEYRYKMLAYQEWRDLYEAGELNAEQSQFFERRPAELLFNLDADPHEVHNLAEDPRYDGILKELRSELQTHIKSMPDLSFYPESYFLEEGAQNPVAFGQRHKQDIAELVEVADLCLLPFGEARGGLESALAAEDPWTRYWACIACSSFGDAAEPIVETIRQLAKNDAEPLVRVRAAEFLGLLGEDDVVAVIMKALADVDSAAEANLMLNTAALLESGYGYDFTPSDDQFPREWLTNGRRRGLVGQRIDFLAK